MADYPFHREIRRISEELIDWNEELKGLGEEETVFLGRNKSAQRGKEIVKEIVDLLDRGYSIGMEYQKEDKITKNCLVWMTVVACLTVGLLAGIICYKTGIQDEKIGWLEDQVIELRKGQ